MKLEETSIRLNFQQFDMRHHLPQCLVVNRLSHDKKEESGGVLYTGFRFIECAECQITSCEENNDKVQPL